MASPAMKQIHGEFLRFLLVGAVNTLSRYLIYCLLLTVCPYLLAYTLAYCLGIVISYFLNVRFVFKRDVSLASFLAFPLVYLLQYGLGALALWILVGRIGLSPELAMVGVILITIPVTFLASRFVLGRKHQTC
jgi:putative flippase GtrA